MTGIRSLPLSKYTVPHIKGCTGNCGREALAAAVQSF